VRGKEIRKRPPRGGLFEWWVVLDSNQRPIG
jgi:hypothetical protein